MFPSFPCSLENWEANLRCMQTYLVLGHAVSHWPIPAVSCLFSFCLPLSCFLPSFILPFILCVLMLASLNPSGNKVWVLFGHFSLKLNTTTGCFPEVFLRPLFLHLSYRLLSGCGGSTCGALAGACFSSFCLTSSVTQGECFNFAECFFESSMRIIVLSLLGNCED